MKTFEELCKEAETRTLERVATESPSISDTPRRRFAVYQQELSALLAASSLPVNEFEVQTEAEAFAFGLPQAAKAPETPSETPSETPQNTEETPISDEK